MIDSFLLLNPVDTSVREDESVFANFGERISDELVSFLRS